MHSIPSRLLLTASAALLLFGGAVHALAYKKAVAAVAASNLAAFYVQALKGLWLIDSATLVTLAIVFGVLAARPTLASGIVVVLLALVPAATAALLYYFIGSSAPAHLLLVAAALTFFAAVLRGNA
jgi:hypothetical protein